MKRRRTYTRDFKISVVREVEMGKKARSGVTWERDTSIPRGEMEEGIL